MCEATWVCALMPTHVFLLGKPIKACYWPKHTRFCSQPFSRRPEVKIGSKPERKEARLKSNNDRCGVLSCSPGKSEDATARGVSVGWRVGCHVRGVVDLCKQRAGQNVVVPQLPIVSECLREGCQASLIEEAYHERGQVGGQIGMGARKGRGTGIRELGRLTPLLHKAKEVLKVREQVQGPVPQE